MKEEAERSIAEPGNAAIHFDLDGESSKQPSKPPRRAILSGTSTPSRSRPSTPPSVEEHDQDRETAKMRERGETWEEGPNEVTESEDGEHVMVVRRDRSR